MTLTTNRYGVVTPTQIFETGITVSVPVYISISQDVAKTLLNGFRVAKQKELLENNQSYESNSVSVVTNSAPKMTQIEQELGMDENTLRSTLFNKGGISERVIIKLQNLLGIEVVTKEQIQKTYEEWIGHLYPPSPSKRSKKTEG